MPALRDQDGVADAALVSVPPMIARWRPPTRAMPGQPEPSAIQAVVALDGRKLASPENVAE